MKTYKSLAILYREGEKQYLERLIYGGLDLAKDVLNKMKEENPEKDYFIDTVDIW